MDNEIDVAGMDNDTLIELMYRVLAEVEARIRYGRGSEE